MSTVITDPYSTDRIWLEYKEKQSLEKDKKALAAVLATEEGRWLFERLLEIAAYRANVFTGNSFTYYNEGRRSVGVESNNKIVQLLGMQGVNLRQKAEREHIAFMEKQWRLFKNDPNER